MQQPVVPNLPSMWLYTSSSMAFTLKQSVMVYFFNFFNSFQNVVFFFDSSELWSVIKWMINFFKVLEYCSNLYRAIKIWSWCCLFKNYHMMFMKLYPYASKIPKMHYTREVHIPDDIVRYSTGTSKCLELKRVVLNKCRITNIYCSLLPDLVHLGISGLCDLRKSIVSSRVLFPRTSKMFQKPWCFHINGMFTFHSHIYFADSNLLSMILLFNS